MPHVHRQHLPKINSGQQHTEEVLLSTDIDLSLQIIEQPHLWQPTLHLDPYSREAIQFNEANRLTNHQETLTKYYSFASTVQQIKVVIHRRVEKDFYGWVDFQDEHYNITNNYYIRRKHLIQNNKKMQKYLKNTHSMQSTGSGDDKIVRQYIENKIKKELDNERLVKLSQ